MTQKPKSRRRKPSSAAPFLDLLEQMENLFATIELDWPDDVMVDARRRLSRIERALRYAPETRERM